jgi:DNA-binding XRE family transcriptional regulator
MKFLALISGLSISGINEHFPKKIIHPLDIHETIGYNRIMTGQELKDWRRKWGLSQEELGKALGVFRVSISRWETGTRSIPSFLPLALQALETNLAKERSHGNLS